MASDSHSNLSLHKKVITKEELGEKLDIKNKLVLSLLSFAFPLVRKFVTRQLTKVTGWITVSLTTVLASYAIDNEDSRANVAAVVGGLVSLVLIGLDLGSAWLNFKLNPPPKAQLVKEEKE